MADVIVDASSCHLPQGRQSHRRGILTFRLSDNGLDGSGRLFQVQKKRKMYRCGELRRRWTGR
jgi:hypothetical protein